MVLFHDREDYMFFLRIVKKYQHKYGFKLYAICLMSNHIHLLMKDKGIQLPVIMDVIESIYASYYISKYKYKGRIFESRFKSKVCRDDKMFLIEHRYINRNAVAAGMVDDFLEYSWSAPTPLTDMFNLIDFEYIEKVYMDSCKVGYMEYLGSSADDLWLNPVEMQRMEDADANNVYNNIKERMSIEPDELSTQVYNEKTSSFIMVCKTHGITKKQLMQFTGLSLYKLNKLQKIFEKFNKPPGGEY